MSNKNYHTVGWRNRDGEIKMGHLHDDNNLSNVMMRDGHDKRTYVSIDTTGELHRQHGIMCSATGSFQVKSGQEPLIDGENAEGGSGDVKPGVPAIYLDAENGDIVLRAPSGRIRMEAIDVMIRASGENGERGYITIDANDKVLLKAQTIDASSKVSTKIFSEKTVEMIGDGIMNIYGGMIDMADGATKVKGSLGGSTNEDQSRGGYGIGL